MRNIGKSIIFIVCAFLFFILKGVAQRSIYEPLDLEKVEFSFDDFGTMWTFDAVPLDEYQQQFGFTPDDEWLEHVQQSALQLGNGCSASFVSEDGLIMTNHHCIRGYLSKIQKNDENLYRDGYYAETPEAERQIPNLYADCLISITDVSNEIHQAMENGATDKEKVKLKNEKIEEIVEEYEKETGYTCEVVTLYNGGKYSLYAYKRYEDVRLVMAPDVQIACTGWDWDNFTYPRYELDFAFLRAYDDNGNPVKVKHYFAWNKKGADHGEATFVVGRPGNTDRLLSMRELQYFKEVRHQLILHRFNEIYQAYFTFFEAHPERFSELLSQLLSVANTRKAFAGMLMALNDEYLMTKKQDFEMKLIEKVKNNNELNKKYGSLWDDIDKTINEMSELMKKQYPFYLAKFYQPAYFKTAENLVHYANQIRLPEAERRKPYRKEHIKATEEEIFVETNDKNRELEALLVRSHESFFRKVKGADCEYLKTLYNKKQGKAAFEYFIEATQLDEPAFVEQLLAKGADAILSSNDPLLQYAVDAEKVMRETEEKSEEVQSRLEVLNQKLGYLIYKVYGDKIPPDATSTLRISHGKIKGYEYNGTLAPGKTTYYGLWNRYYSFGGRKYPWGLHERWQKVPDGFDLSTPIAFASTNDIVGGNSGSAIINKNAEVVGLAHDGNLESLAGAFAFLREDNRTVATDSFGLLEALKFVYKTERLMYELQNGKMKK